MVTSPRKRPASNQGPSTVPRPQRGKAKAPAKPVLPKKAKKPANPRKSKNSSVASENPGPAPPASGPPLHLSGYAPQPAHPAPVHPSVAGTGLHPSHFHPLATQMNFASGANVDPRFLFANQPHSVHSSQTAQGPPGYAIGGAPGHFHPFPYQFPIDPALLGYPASLSSAAPPGAVPHSPPQTSTPPALDATAEGVNAGSVEGGPGDFEGQAEAASDGGPHLMEEESASDQPATDGARDNTDAEPQETTTAAGFAGGSANSTPKEKKKRVYPSDVNPQEGVIDGVGRGDCPVDNMARKRSLKPLPKTQTSASKVFNDTTREILTRCEDLANRTASWIYVAMHHPGAKVPFTHFASRRVRKEAPEELQRIHKEVSNMMKTLARADTTVSLQHIRESAEAQRAAEEAAKQAEEAAQRAQEADERASRAEQENARLRQQLDARNKVISSLYSGSSPVPGVPTATGPEAPATRPE
ncbi:hypothetical protein MD484_g8856, partial [Candolleomyces efflorescens]